jgi:hypothetical protein
MHMMTNGATDRLAAASAVHDGQLERAGAEPVRWEDTDAGAGQPGRQERTGEAAEAAGGPVHMVLLLLLLLLGRRDDGDAGTGRLMQLERAGEGPVCWDGGDAGAGQPGQPGRAGMGPGYLHMDPARVGMGPGCRRDGEAGTGRRMQLERAGRKPGAGMGMRPRLGKPGGRVGRGRK